uniref:BTB domain-containing protein n=1 Tax=Setaria italica TaxID=4555 RepID=K3ZLU6_SETIT
MSNSSSPSAAAAGIGGGASSAGSCSTSIITEAGSHVLRVECYSATKRLGVGKFIELNAFIVGGLSWVFRYYPNGDNKGSTNWIAVDVFCLDSKDEILDKEGEPAPRFYAARNTKVRGSHWYGLRSELEESEYLGDDCLNIKCEQQRVTVPPSDLHQDLGRLLLSGKGGDVVFEVGGERFTAHRNILAARSSVFGAELFGPMKEKTAAHIQIQDMESNVFRALLHFMYTDSLPAMEEAEEIVMAQHLLVAADMYDLKRLKLITVATTLVLAEQHACLLLKDYCLQFLVSPGNLKPIMETDEYRHLKSSCPSLLQDLLDKFATCKLVYWINNLNALHQY